MREQVVGANEEMEGMPRKGGWVVKGRKAALSEPGRQELRLKMYRSGIE